MQVSASLDGDSVQRPGSVAHRDTPDSSRLGGLGQSPMPRKIISPSPSQTPMPSTAGAGLLNPTRSGSDQLNSWPVVPQRPSYASVQSLFRKADEGKPPLHLTFFYTGADALLICRCLRRIDQESEHEIPLKLRSSSEIQS